MNTKGCGNMRGRGMFVRLPAPTTYQLYQTMALSSSAKARSGGGVTRRRGKSPRKVAEGVGTGLSAAEQVMGEEQLVVADVAGREDESFTACSSASAAAEANAVGLGQARAGTGAGASATASGVKCYADGTGVPKDLVEAMKWCLLASSTFGNDAAEWIETHEKDLTSGQYAEARARAEAFHSPQQKK